MTKRRLIIFLLGSLFLYILSGIFIIQYEVDLFSNSLNTKNPEYFYDYSGITHIHSDASTGSGSKEHISKEAELSNLDFIYITDLNVFDLKPPKESKQGKTLVFMAKEFTYLDSKLLLYHRQSPRRLTGPGNVHITFSDMLGRKKRDPDEGLLVLSHPYKPNYQWEGAYPPGLDGIEVVNLKTLWENAWLKSKASFFWTLLVYPFNPNLSFIRLFKFPVKNLALFDKLSSIKPTIGFLGTDAEAMVSLGANKGFKFPSYNQVFSYAKTHVLLQSELTGTFKRDKSKIQKAISEGQFYISLDSLANPKGFSAFITNKSHQILPLGTKTTWEEDMVLNITYPSKPNLPVEAFIFKNGVLVANSSSLTPKVKLQTPGVYRVLIRVRLDLPLPDGPKWKDWIFTNPFYLKQPNNKPIKSL